MFSTSSNHAQILLDIGSTNIKYFRLIDGVIADGGYFPRDFNQAVAEQVQTILQQELNLNSESDSLRICSSANGGLRVGVICYTEKFSGGWAAKSALNAGANVVWVKDSVKLQESIDPIDILVIAGGADHSPVERQRKWLSNINRKIINVDTVVFAGNKNLVNLVSEFWPSVVHVPNVLGEDMSWQGEALSQVLRQAYLNDLVCRKGISGLQKFSEVAILPTPAIVQESFSTILSNKASIKLLEPLILIDIGGATTDVYYGGELISAESGNIPRPPINRYVFTHLGICSSKQSLLMELSLLDELGSFLRALEPVEAERRYLSLREGDVDWVTPDFLAEACCFLALNYCLNGKYIGHKIDVTKIQTIAITGGASQICNVDRLERIFYQCGALNANAYLDKNYQIWIEGMLRQKP